MKALYSRYPSHAASSIRLAAFAVLVLAFSAIAEPPKNPVHWRADFDEAFEIALERNVPVVLAIIQDGEAENERMVPECYENKSFIELSRMCVMLVGSRGTSSEHGVLEVEVDGRTRRICNKFGSITCPEHQEVEMAIFREYSDNGSLDTPHHVIVHPEDRRVLGRHDDHVERSMLMSSIRKAQREVGRGLTDEDYAEAKKNLAEAADALKQKDYPKAIELYDWVASLRADGKLIESAGEKLGEIEELGNEMLADAEKAGAKRDFGNAFLLISTIKEDFKFFKKTLGKSASKLERALKKDPEGRAAAAALKLEPKAKAALEKAEQMIDMKNYLGAVRDLEGIVDKFGSTPSAKRASELLEYLQGNEQIREAIAEQQMRTDCTKWLRLAKNYFSNDLNEQGAELCKKIVEMYPESEYAAEAKKLLEKSGS